MTRYSSTMSEILSQIREGFSPKQIKMAIGIASDKRYKGGNYTGAVRQIEKIKKGLSDHPQVAAVLKRQNEDNDEPASPDEGSMATDQLEFIKYAADEIMQHIQNGGEFPEWMQNKLSGTHEKMKGLHANINHENVQDQKEGVEPIQWPSQPLEEELDLDLDEMKMDDPKLVKAFDKMKKGDTIKLKTSSTISKGKDFVDYIVKAKNVVNKGKVEKVTLVTKGNEKAVKKFLYKRDGKVTFAIGDMGASIDDIKEAALMIAEKLKVSDGLGAWITDFQKSDAPQFDGKSEEQKKKMAIAAFVDAGGKLESVKEEEEPKEPEQSDGAKAVAQGREDKKKTRIAQLQLQIAKAQETINKLNAQEKPSE